MSVFFWIVIIAVVAMVLLWAWFRRQILMSAAPAPNYPSIQVAPTRRSETLRRLRSRFGHFFIAGTPCPVAMEAVGREFDDTSDGDLALAAAWVGYSADQILAALLRRFEDLESEERVAKTLEALSVDKELLEQAIPDLSEETGLSRAVLAKMVLEFTKVDLAQTVSLLGLQGETEVVADLILSAGLDPVETYINLREEEVGAREAVAIARAADMSWLEIVRAEHHYDNFRAGSEIVEVSGVLRAAGATDEEILAAISDAGLVPLLEQVGDFLDE